MNVWDIYINYKTQWKKRKQYLLKKKLKYMGRWSLFGAHSNQTIFYSSIDWLWCWWNVLLSAFATGLFDDETVESGWVANEFLDWFAKTLQAESILAIFLNFWGLKALCHDELNFNIVLCSCSNHSVVIDVLIKKIDKLVAWQGQLL